MPAQTIHTLTIRTRSKFQEKFTRIYLFSTLDVGCSTLHQGLHQQVRCQRQRTADLPDTFKRRWRYWTMCKRKPAKHPEAATHKAGDNAVAIASHPMSNQIVLEGNITAQMELMATWVTNRLRIIMSIWRKLSSQGREAILLDDGCRPASAEQRSTQVGCEQRLGPSAKTTTYETEDEDSTTECAKGNTQ